MNILFEMIQKINIIKSI